MRTVDITWDPLAGRFTALGAHGGHPIQINAPEIEAAADGHRPPTGFSATELLLAGAGACAAWDVVTILHKGRHRLTGVTVRVIGEQDADPPRCYRRLELAFRVTGRGLDPAQVRRAVRLSVDRYCSVLATVRGRAEIVDSVELVEESGAPVAG
jgi:putative redox protein